jgi:hypothetical protein
MIWPTPNDYAAAVRNPAAAFADPDLAAADVVLGRDGRPEAHSGDTAHVYQLCAEDGRSWAVKCFGRIDDGRPARYAAVRDAIGAQPFAVGFEHLADGIAVAGRRWPVLKMDWVEGASLYRVAKDRCDSPAVMDGLFKRWVQLARELRAAGVAHGDLQHANVLLVPGKWPGSYALKLVDYDAMYVPALAGVPTYEAGHPNYRHPGRDERSYSPDLDRFPLLAVATALKALAVRGPDLWRAHGSRDCLLFTAADFKNPGESKLMRRLWRSDDPALRALVGHLALACARPLADTPRLDDLCANGTPSISANEAKAVDAVLRPDTPSMAAFTLDDEPVIAAEVVEAEVIAAEAVAAFTLDDEPPAGGRVEQQKARRRPDGAGASPKSAGAPRRPLTPVPVATDDEDEDERSRLRPKRRPEPAGNGLLLAAAVVFGLMVLVGGGIAAWLLTRERPAETTTPADEPTPAPAPNPPPTTPNPAPQPNPEPPHVGPPGFHRVWARPIDNGRFDARPLIALDGRAAFVAYDRRVYGFDGRTGAPRKSFLGKAPVSVLGLWALPNDRVAVSGEPLFDLHAMDGRTGEPVPLLDRPPFPAGGVPAGVEYQVSPDGRYVFAGQRGFQRGVTSTPAPYRVVEAGTGNVVASGDWAFGTVRFTADGARVLMAETSGRVRWVSLKTGGTEAEWAFGPGMPLLGGVSADGALFTYLGTPSGMPLDCYLMDGKTGQALRRVGLHFSGEHGTLTADGKYLVGITNEPPTFRDFFAVVADARTGEVLVRTPLDGTINDLQRASFTPDGRTFALYHRGKKELQMYELRGAIPASTAAVPVAVGPVPGAAPPGGAVGVVPPLPPPPFLPPGGGLPPAPVLRQAWKGAIPGAAVNQIPVTPTFTRDGATVVVSGGLAGTVLTFDAKTGAAGAVFDGHKVQGGTSWVSPVGNDRVASGGFDYKSAVWDVKTGRSVDAVTFPDLPPLPAGLPGHAGLTFAVSPGGRYTAQARREAARAGVVPGPLRVLDTTTGRVVVSADWNGGQVVFAADESRALVLDGLGKAAWYKLPSGEADGGWAAGAGRPAETARVLGVTADGETVLYHGPLGGRATGVYLLEGRTGRVVRSVDAAAPYQRSYSALSPDGRYVAMGVIDFAAGAHWHVDVFETAGWRLVGRCSSAEGGKREPPQFAFTPDGKGLCCAYPGAKEVAMFALP